MCNRSNARVRWGLRRRSLQDGVERLQLTGPSTRRVTADEPLQPLPATTTQQTRQLATASIAGSSQATATATTRSQSHQSQTHPTSADTSLGAPSPSFASSSSTGTCATEPRYHSYPSQGCCADCATWSSHGTTHAHRSIHSCIDTHIHKQIIIISLA